MRHLFHFQHPNTLRRIPVENYIDSIVAAVAAGATMGAACTKAGISRATVERHARKRPDVKARLIAAAGDRPGAKPRHAYRAFTEADWTAALDRIAGSKVGIAHVLTDLPSVPTLYARAARDPEFRIKFNRAMGDKVYRRDRAKPPKSPTAPWGALRRALKAHPLYRRAAKAVRGGDPNEFDDLVHEVIVQMLEGGEPDRKTASQRVRGGHGAFRSLDVPVFNTGNAETLGDTIESPCEISEY